MPIIGGMKSNGRARAAGAVVAALLGAGALGVGAVAGWASLTLLLGSEPSSDPAFGNFVGVLLAPIAVIATVLGAGLLHIARRTWRRARGTSA